LFRRTRSERKCSPGERITQTLQQGEIRIMGTTLEVFLPQGLGDHANSTCRVKLMPYQPSVVSEPKKAV
jgi:hypothetical protein